MPCTALRCRRLAFFLTLLLSGPTMLPAATIWVEGEKPVRSSMHRHPWWYDQVKRDQLSGGDLISNFADQPGEASYEVKISQAGTYALWVRANPVQAQMAYKLGTGAWQEIDLAHGGVDQVNIAADGKPDLRFLAWFNLGKVQLAAGMRTIAYRMHSANHNHGYLDCFVLTDEPFQPRGALQPGQLAAANRRAEEAEKGWFAFTPRDEAFGPESGFDLRSLNEKFAGEGGFIGVQDGHFVHSESGTPLRFWAVNGPPHDLKDRAEIRRCARLLAKYGINLARIHGGYYDKSGNLQSADAVQHTIDVVESLKPEGIYSHLSIYFPLWLTPQPGTPFLPGYNGRQHPFAALYFNPAFQEQYRQWWKHVLLTPGAKSGKRLIDEPALAGVEIINEDSYLFWTFDAKNIPEPELVILEKQFGDWAKKKHGSLEATLAAWKGSRQRRDDPAAGRLAFRPLWNMTRDKSPRDCDTIAFLVESQWTFYRDTLALLRKLGFRGLITASNWTTADAEVLGPLEKFSYTPGDFLDRHGYLGCFCKGDNAEWSLRDGHTYRDRDVLRFEAEPPGKPRVFNHPAMDPHYDGKPSMLSETAYCRPNRYRSEAPLFFAAYGALQDSDAIVHFACDGTRWEVKPGFFMQPWTLMSPATLGQFPAAALIYRQGLVANGALLADVHLNIHDLLQLQGTPLPQDAALDELRLKDVGEGAGRAGGGRIDPLIHFAGRTAVHFTRQPAHTHVEDLARFIDHRRETVASSSGELQLDYGRGLLTINAPAAQGLSGALAKAGATPLRDIVISSDLELGNIVAVSLDGRPLATSRKMLLQVMSEERNAGFQSEPAGGGLQRIVHIGHDPWMVRELRGSVRFRRPDAARLKVVSLDHSGYPQKSQGTAEEVRLAPTTMYYLIEGR